MRAWSAAFTFIRSLTCVFSFFCRVLLSVLPLAISATPEDLDSLSAAEICFLPEP